MGPHKVLLGTGLAGAYEVKGQGCEWQLRTLCRGYRAATEGCWAREGSVAGRPPLGVHPALHVTTVLFRLLPEPFEGSELGIMWEVGLNSHPLSPHCPFVPTRQAQQLIFTCCVSEVCAST